MIETGGVQVFPRLVAPEHETQVSSGTRLPSDIAGLDALLGGGVERGSSILILGPAGTGKSLLALQVHRRRRPRAANGGHVRLRRGTGPALRPRQRLGIDLEAMVDAGASWCIEQIDAAELSPGEFSAPGARIASRSTARSTVVIDSLNGYQAAMPEENSLILHMHELLQYLNRQGATTFLTVAQHGLVGDMKSPVDVTYLADTVVLLRYFEAVGRVRRAISIVKKRTGAHENTIREYRIGADGIAVGRAVDRFPGRARGVSRPWSAAPRA